MIPVHTNLLAKYRPLPKENKITQAYEEQQKELKYGLHSTPTEEQWVPVCTLLHSDPCGAWRQSTAQQPPTIAAI